MNKIVDVVIYYRVSTKRQGASGLGLEAQEESVSGYLRTVDSATTIAEFKEIESGGDSKRPELKKAIRRCRLTGATLVVAKLDRLARDLEFIAHLQKSSVKFVCADMPEANSLTIAVLAAVAEHERKMTSLRTVEALKMAKRKGVRLGNPNLHLVRNTNTDAARKTKLAKAASRNFALRETLDEFVADSPTPLTDKQLAELLNGAGYKTSRNNHFTKQAVSRIFEATDC